MIKVGMKFGCWTIVSKGQKDRKRNAYWICQCDCGKVVSVSADNLKRGKSTRCTECRNYSNASKNQKHGDAKPRHNQSPYRTWKAMNDRCRNPNSQDYSYYGGKGIKVCSEWAENYLAFRTWAVSAGWKPGLTIDRINPTGDYSPSNCQWLTNSENAKKMHRDRSKLQ
mgnify:CR=1 FL=1